MSHFQQVIYQGYMGGDPEMRYTPSGKAVANFSLGSSVSRKNKDGEYVKKTTWLKVVCWEGLAEIVSKYGKKGMPVQVVGVLNANEYGNPSIWTKQDGTPAASFEVTAREVFMSPTLGDKKSAQSEEVPQDDIPF